MKTISKTDLIKAGIVTKEQLKTDIYRQIVDEITSKMPLELGKRLIEEIESKEHQVGIASKPLSEEDVLKSGYQLESGREIEESIKLSGETPLFLLRQCLLECSSEKQKNVYIVKIPQIALKYSKGESMPILFPTDQKNKEGFNSTILLAEYILGYYTTENGEILEFIENPRYKETHEYMPDGLEYTNNVIESYCEENGIGQAEEKIQIEEIEDRISEEYKQEHPLRDNAFVADVKPKSEVPFSNKEHKAMQNAGMGLFEKIKEFFKSLKKSKERKMLEEAKQRSKETK